MKTNKRAVDYIIDLVKRFDSTASIHFDPTSPTRYVYLFRINIQGQNIDLQFNRGIMDDFEIAIKEHKDTDYYFNLENSVKFKIYVLLGSRGFIPDFEVSSEFLNEKGQWLERYSVNVSFDERICEALYGGLRKLAEFLRQVLKDHKSGLRDMRAEKEYIDSLVQYYEKHGHLSSEGVGVESLGFLKAAAVCEIIEKEKEKMQTDIPRVKKEIDKQIYSIVESLREAPFPGIRLPECIRDYNIAAKKRNDISVSVQPKAMAGKHLNNKLDALLDNLNPNLKNKRIGAWMTFESDNPDRLSQSANSMVELLDKVIGQVCQEKELPEYLKEKYGTKEETQWLYATKKWISETKSNLHRVKHHADYKAEILALSLLENAESIMLVILE
ncbi:MAG: hypothetical protein J7M38_08910 [Armatimonadetes bacterium]|nr:hypothetical protein [Armatimonadota bacterium]